MTRHPATEAAHPRSRNHGARPSSVSPQSTAALSTAALCCAACCAVALVLASLPAAPAAAEPPTRAGIETAADPVRQVRVPLDRLANFDRLRETLSHEATVEDLLEDGDRRDLTAVRAWVDRCNRVESCTLQDNPHDFDDGRDVLRSLAKESLRDYVKQQVRWEDMQDRMRLRVRNFFLSGRQRDARPSTRSAASTDDNPLASGAFELAPELDLDLDDTELGVDFSYAPARYRFLADWELSYRERVQQTGRSLRLRYSGGDRWFDLTTAMDDDDLGNYVAVSVTQLF